MAGTRPDQATAALARRAWALAAMAVVAFVLAGCSASAPRGGHASPSFTAPPGHPPAWMLTRAALAQMMASPAVRTGLERTRVYEILSPGQTPLAAAGALPVVSFSSASELKPALTLTTPRPGAGPRWRQFLDLGLAGALARVCDVIELQAQSLERDTRTYAAFVR